MEVEVEEDGRSCRVGTFMGESEWRCKVREIRTPGIDRDRVDSQQTRKGSGSRDENGLNRESGKSLEDCPSI